jgi:hypothetical protein
LLECSVKYQERSKSRGMRRNGKSPCLSLEHSAYSLAVIGLAHGVSREYENVASGDHIVALSHPFEDARDNDFRRAFKKLLDYCSLGVWITLKIFDTMLVASRLSEVVSCKSR